MLYRPKSEGIGRKKPDAVVLDLDYDLRDTEMMMGVI